MTEKIQTEFHVEVVQLGAIQKHPNADSLSMVDVNGYPVIIRTVDFKVGDLAVYVPVDALVPVARPEFAFLAKKEYTHHRVRAARLRGIFSMGLLVPVPKDVGPVALGDDLAVQMGVLKYVSPAELRLERVAFRKAHQLVRNGPKLPVYGLEPLRRFSDVIEPGEKIHLTEKIHGTNTRYCFDKGRLWVGSHKVMRGCSRNRLAEWFHRLRLRVLDLLGRRHRAGLLRDAGDVWWETAEKYQFKERLAAKPGFVLYGEIYGESVQDLTYDSPKGRRFRAFDVYDLPNQRFLDVDDFRAFILEIGLDLDKDVVPLMYVGPWSETVKSHYCAVVNSGKSQLNGDQVIEGFVVKPLHERMDPRVGRVALKYVGSDYLLRDDGKGNVSGKAAAYKQARAAGFPNGDRVIRPSIDDM